MKLLLGQNTEHCGCRGEVRMSEDRFPDCFVGGSLTDGSCVRGVEVASEYLPSVVFFVSLAWESCDKI